jgi:hypothetical protein
MALLANSRREVGHPNAGRASTRERINNSSGSASTRLAICPATALTANAGDDGSSCRVDFIPEAASVGVASGVGRVLEAPVAFAAVTVSLVGASNITVATRLTTSEHARALEAHTRFGGVVGGGRANEGTILVFALVATEFLGDDGGEVDAAHVGALSRKRARRDSRSVPDARSLHVAFALSDQPAARKSAITGNLEQLTSGGRGVAELVQKILAHIVDCGESEEGGCGIRSDGLHVLTREQIQGSNCGEATNDVGHDANTNLFDLLDLLTNKRRALEETSTIGDRRVSENDEKLDAVGFVLVLVEDIEGLFKTLPDGSLTSSFARVILLHFRNCVESLTSIQPHVGVTGNVITVGDTIGNSLSSVGGAIENHTKTETSGSDIGGHGSIARPRADRLDDASETIGMTTESGVHDGRTFNQEDDVNGRTLNICRFFALIVSPNALRELGTAARIRHHTTSEDFTASRRVSGSGEIFASVGHSSAIVGSGRRNLVVTSALCGHACRRRNGDGPSAIEIGVALTLGSQNTTRSCDATRGRSGSGEIPLASWVHLAESDV